MKTNKVLCGFCGQETRLVSARCPDGRPGCMVAHYKRVCDRCDNDALLTIAKAQAEIDEAKK